MADEQAATSCRGLLGCLAELRWQFKAFALHAVQVASAQSTMRLRAGL
jgi:hypothetical protein